MAIASAAAFAQDDPPTVSNRSPHSSLTGINLPINGTRLGQVKEIDFFNGEKATIVTPGSTSLRVKVPDSATTGPTTLVTTSNGNLTLTPDFMVTGSGGRGGSTFVDPPHLKLPIGAMTGHPRIFFCAADVPKYQASATPSNPLWQSFNSAAQTARQAMNNHLILDQNEGDGAGNYSPYPTEKYAELFAFMSLVDPKGQKLFLTSVSPANSTLSPQAVPPSPSGPDKNETVNGELMLNRIMIEDSSKPKTCNFLNVLQGEDAGASPMPVTGFHQKSGEAIDGCYFGSNSVACMRVIKGRIATTTYTVPNTVSSFYIIGLKPGATYTITQTSAAGGVQITLSAGGSATPDNAGVLKL